MVLQLQLPGFPDDLWTPIQLIRSCGVRHRNYVRFVRDAAARAAGYIAGSTILCAAPDGLGCDELVADLQRELQHLNSAAADHNGASVAVLPPSLTNREKDDRRALISTYLQSLWPRRRKPMDPSAAYQRSETQIQELAALLRSQEPDIYILQSIHLVQGLTGSFPDTGDAILRIAEVARQSQRTHLLFGNTRTLVRIGEMPDVARQVDIVVLRPYDLRSETDRLEMGSTAAAYDTVIPWAEGKCLRDNLDEIDDAIRGGVHRLRRWLVSALCAAVANRESCLMWKRFTENGPTAAEVKDARDEFLAVEQFFAAPPPSSVPSRPIPSGRRCRRLPGIRKPNRDPMPP